MKKKGTRTRFRGVQSLGNRKYRLRLYVTNPISGKQKQRMRTVTAASAAAAAKLRLEYQEELQQEEQRACQGNLHGSMKLGELARSWLAEICSRRLEEDPEQLHLTPGTRVRYTRTVTKFIVPAPFASKRADRITREDVRLWRDSLLLRGGYRRSTVNSHHRVLKSILLAVGNVAATKVARLNEKPDAQITRTQPNLLTGEELDRFLQTAQQERPQHYALILVLVTTTMRIGTALALQWDDLDLDSMEFVVTRRLSGDGKNAEVIPGVKRDRFGEDVPPLLPEVYQALLAHRASFNQAQHRSGLMFPSLSGGHHSRNILWKPFRDIRKKANITKRFTPHGCRRTGSKLYGRTAGTRLAMEIAGHRTEEMHRLYTPVDADEKQDAARKAFGTLTVINGGLNETVTQTVTPRVFGDQ